MDQAERKKFSVVYGEFHSVGPVLILICLISYSHPVKIKFDESTLQ